MRARSKLAQAIAMEFFYVRVGFGVQRMEDVLAAPFWVRPLPDAGKLSVRCAALVSGQTAAAVRPGT